MNYAGRFNSFILKGQNVFDAIKAYHEMDGITHLEFNYPEHFEGYDLEGNKIRIRAREDLSIAFQHEIDHLDGILFVDKIDPKNPYKDRNKMREI